MKAPLRVLLFSIFIVVVMVLITLYRFDLLKFKIESTTPETTENKTAPVTPTREPVPTPSTQPKVDLANGKKLFEDKTCVLCHGANGSGNTPMGKAVSVTNLTHAKFKSNKENLPRLQYILQVIQNGVPGTAMVSFKDQIPSEKDQLDLASYVNSFYK